MADGATIIAASLNSEELDKSINKLVETVNSKTKEMAKSFDSSVQEMKRSLQSLGDTKIKFQDTGGSKRVSDVKRESEARKELTTTIDANANAMQRIMRKPSTAEESYYTFVKSMRENVALLAMEIKSMPSVSLDKQFSAYMQFERQIDQTKQRIAELRQELNQLGSDPNSSRLVIKQTTEEIARLQQEVVRLEREQLQTTNQIANEEKQALAAKQAQYEKEKQLLFEMSGARQQTAQATQQAAQAAQQQADAERQSVGAARELSSAKNRNALDERDAAEAARQHLETVKEIAAMARQSMGNKYTSWQMPSRLENSMVYAESDSRANGLTIEQQIEKLLKEEAEDYNRINSASQQQLSTEQQITSEVEKRKKVYKKPISEIDGSFKSMVANRLGVDVGSINSSATSIEKLTLYIKQLETAYSKLSRADRNTAFGKQLREQIQLSKRELKSYKAEMERPINFGAVKNMPTRTLDEIAQKMRMLQAYRGGLNVNTQKDEINQVTAKYNELKKKMDEILQKNQQMVGSNNALSRSWNYMKNRLAFYFTVGASTQFVRNLIEVRSQYEMNERALGILINSAERGTQIFNELSQMALVSPYTLLELSAAAKQLTAYDIAAKDVVDTTRRLADMASAVGVPIERLTYALGQIKAYGYLNSRDNRMFANAGIPLVKQLADYYTELEGKIVSTADVYDRIKKKAVDYNDVMQVINKMTDEGGKFFDFQAKMADTLKVRLANLTLAWNNMLNEIGESQQGVLTAGIGALRSLFLHWKQFDDLIKNAAWALGVRTAVVLLAYAVLQLGNALSITSKQMALSAVFGNKLSLIIKNVARSFVALATNPLTWWALAAVAAVELTQALLGANEAQKQLNQSIRKGAEENYKNLEDYLVQSSKLRNSLYEQAVYANEQGKTQTKIDFNKVVDINQDEAKKAWEAMEEQINLSTAAGNEYIGTLLQIDNISERLRQGFKIIDDIKAVNAAFKEMGDTALDISQNMSAWWNLQLAPDGLIQNIKDYTKAIEDARKVSEFHGYLYDLKIPDKEDAHNLEVMKKDLDEFSKSVNNFIENNGFSANPTQVTEAWATAIKKLAQEGQLTPQETFNVQKEVEEARTVAIKEALKARIESETQAYKDEQNEMTKAALAESIKRNQEQLRMFENTTAESRVYWGDFTKFMKERHMSELQAMFGNMTEEQIRNIDFSEAKWNEFVERSVTSYAKAHKMSYDDAFTYLHKWVNDANQWAVFIKLHISTDGTKSITEVLKEQDQLADAAYQNIQRLREYEKELVGAGAEATVNKLHDRLVQTRKEISDAEKDYATSTSIEKGGKSKKEESQAAKERKKNARDAAKAQKAAESEIQRALKDELQLIDKIRGTYKDLTKEGLSHIDAVESATRGYSKSVDTINQTLTKYGLTKFDPAKYAGISNPRELVELLQKQLDDLMKSGRVKPSEIQDIEVKIREINVDAEKYDLKKITDGLNNELGKLKEEYELAVELDANPELGDIFANMLGVSESDLADIPRKAEDVAIKAQNIINDIFKENNVDDVFNLEQNLNKANLKAWAERNGHDLKDGLMSALTAIVDYVNKARLDQTKKQVEEWDKLLEKYAEYEYKKEALRKQYEREMQIATERGAGGDIINAITNKYKTEMAQLDFDEFQKTPYWVTATGELSSLTTDALGLLIDKLEQYKKTAQNLSPKQIERINKALRSMRKEVRKDNPWKILANAMDEAKARGEVFDESIQKTENQIAALEQKIAAQRKNNNGIADEKDIKTLNGLYDALKRLKEAQESVSKVSYKDVIEQINAYLAIAQSAAGVFQQIAQTTKDSSMARSADLASDILGNFQAAGQGFASGGWIGAVAAGVGDLLPKIFKWASAENDIDDSIKESERSVKRLEYAYIDLQQAIDNACGTAVVGAKQAALANKALQMEEIKRQIQLEKSRSSKKRDEDKIIDLEKQYKDLYYEIKNGTKEIVDDLMGTDVSGFAENMVKSMISAFKQGEDYMKVFEDSFESMIDNMIMKSIVSRVVAQYMNALWDNLDNRINERSKQEADAYARAQNEAQRISSMSDQEIADEMGFGFIYRNSTAGHDVHDRYQATIDEYRDTIKREEEAAKKQLDAASQITNSDITDIMAEVGAIMPELGEKLKSILGEYYRFGQEGDNNLSALQAGIKGITEEQAGALEAYWNANTQQQYVQSDLLTQIRDTIIGFDLDVQVATMSQILLQLQASYHSQMAIQNILTSVLTPSGRAFSVELIS